MTIGTCWATGTWDEDAWAANTWADAQEAELPTVHTATGTWAVPSRTGTWAVPSRTGTWEVPSD